MVYSKPELYVEKFLVNFSVAAVSCNREQEGWITSFSPQSILCLRQSATTETVFGEDTTGCAHAAQGLEYIAASSATYTGDEFYNKIMAAGVNIPNDVTELTPGAISGNNSSLKVTTSGIFVAWTDKVGSSKGGSHFGAATADVIKKMTSSY